MSKKKLPKVAIPELEAMLKDMEDLLTDEYGNPLTPDHPQVKKLQLLAAQLGTDSPSVPENEGGDSLSGHA